MQKNEKMKFTVPSILWFYIFELIKGWLKKKKKKNNSAILECYRHIKLLVKKFANNQDDIRKIIYRQ